jgi:hypothetical protein
VLVPSVTAFQLRVVFSAILVAIFAGKVRVGLGGGLLAVVNFQTSDSLVFTEPSVAITFQ